MKRFILLALLAGAVVSVPSYETAYAQPAAALGKPLPDGQLPTGTISVKVVAGGPANVVVGADVTLLVNGEARVARSNSDGRAMFPDIPAGAQVQAKIVDADNKEVTSEVFPVPASGGVRVMLTTKPFGASAGPPMGGGGQGMPEARQMSGQPRADRSTEPGTYQVRVTYNNVQIKDGVATDSDPPVGESVVLVGYRYDETVSTQTLKVDKNGYTNFEGLDVSGNSVYFALTRLPRNGNVDRLASVPVQMETQAGAKLILSSDKRTATVPQIDDLAGPQTSMPGPGKVKVTLEGYPRELSEITLIDAVTKQVIAKGRPTVAEPDPSKVEGNTQFTADPSLPKGTLDVRVHGGPGTSDGPLPNVALTVVPVGATNVAEGIASKTGPDGTVRLGGIAADKKHRVLLTVNGKELASTELEVGTSGGKLDVTAHWEDEGTPQIVFDVPYNPAHVLYAETRQMSPLSKKIELYRTMPFLTLETTGAHAAISVLPRILFSFQLQAFVEDEILGVRGLWRVSNNSWIPYMDSEDGLLIKLPKRHIGGVVGDEFQHEVSVAQGEGYRILRALPPGSTQWEAGFSMKADDGEVRWHLDLPLGAFQSMLQIRDFPGLQVDAAGKQGEMQTGRSGTQWLTFDNIMIPTNQSMVMTIRGMPHHPAWKKWVPRFVGLLVVAIMLAGVIYAMTRPRASAGSDAKRKADLMNELVELEKKGVDPKRREQVLAELERLWE
jgi:hypothetical protein